jgi:hypothetical protein
MLLTATTIIDVSSFKGRWVVVELWFVSWVYLFLLFRFAAVVMILIILRIGMVIQQIFIIIIKLIIQITTVVIYLYF